MNKRIILFLFLLFIFNCSSRKVSIMMDTPTSNKEVREFVRIRKSTEELMLNSYAKKDFLARKKGEKINETWISINNDSFDTYIKNTLNDQLMEEFSDTETIESVVLNIKKYEYKHYHDFSFFYSESEFGSEIEVEVEVIRNKNKHIFSYKKQYAAIPNKSLNPFNFGLVAGLILGTNNGILPYGLLFTGYLTTEYLLSRDGKSLKDSINDEIMEFCTFLKKEIKNRK